MLQHYIGDIVYGANDGIVTTFAVVSGVAGGSLSHVAVLVIGAANLVADGVSMGVGNFQSIRASERAREAGNLPEVEAHPWKHGLATLVAFMVAGAIPLVPFLLPVAVDSRMPLSTGSAVAALVIVGTGRARVTGERWSQACAETVLLGVLVAVAGYAAGHVAARWMA
jgi:VIT1/CCC1 family predicted Fe2+/Mn2+ transporter